MKVKYFVSRWIGFFVMAAAVLAGMLVALLAFTGALDQQMAIMIGKACGIAFFAGFFVHVVQMVEGP